MELEEPIEPVVPELLLPLEPLVLGLVLLGLLLELPLGEVLLPLLPMLVEPPEPLPEGEVVLPLEPAVLLPDLVPAVSPPPWPHADSDMAAAAITASAAPRE